MHSSLNGWMAMAAAHQGQWERAKVWAYGEEADPRFRDVIVRAALAKRSGDIDAYVAFENDWLGADPLRPQVDALLTR